MRGAQPSCLWGRRASCPPRDGFAVAVAAGVDRGRYARGCIFGWPRVGALGYNSLRRASRIDLAGWPARSPSQAGSLTSPEVGFTPAGDPLARVSPRLPWDLEDRRPKLDSGLRAPRSSAWLGAETFPDKKVNRRRAAVSERFPAITGWRAGILFSRNSIVQEARTAQGRPAASCAPL